MTRRTALAALGASALLTRPAPAQTAAGPIPGNPAATAHALPLLCAYSQNLAKVPYPELGMIAQDIGYDGVDLTVREGGHVSPRILNVDLVRAIESVLGAGLDVPMITTDIASPSDPAAYPILAITGRTSVHMYRLGKWNYGPGDAPKPPAQMRNDLLSLVVLGQRCNMMALISNRARGNFGDSIADAQSLIAGVDARWAGYCYDPAAALAASGPNGWEAGLRQALPRLKAVAIQDFVWAKNSDQPRMQMCPLGEGIVDWSRFFTALAAAKFSGPMTVHLEYHPPDELSAMKKDLEFLRKQIQQYWPNPSKT